MLENECKLMGYGDRPDPQTRTLVTGATQKYCEELAEHWIKYHPERFHSYKIFVWHGFWEPKIWYERQLETMFQKYELKETIFVC